MQGERLMSHADTGGGFLVGMDPRQPAPTVANLDPSQLQQLPIGQQAYMQQSQDPSQQQPMQAPQGETITVPMTVAPAEGAPPAAPAAPDGQQLFTQEDIERIRREEKDKLYGRLQTMDDELKTIRAEREAAEQARQAEIAAREEALRAEEEEKLSAKALIERRDQEWSQRFNELESQYAADRALFEKERRFNELEAYRQQRIEQDAEYLMPELRDLIGGNSEEEIEQSIEAMKQRTATIMAQLTQDAAVQRQQMRGAAPTAPPVGPMEQMTTYEALTPEDIASMSMEDYRKHRESLIRAAGQSYRG